jgi:hypothetical protein
VNKPAGERSNAVCLFVEPSLLQSPFVPDEGAVPVGDEILHVIPKREKPGHEAYVEFREIIEIFRRDLSKEIPALFRVELISGPLDERFHFLIAVAGLVGAPFLEVWLAAKIRLKSA